MGFRSSATPYSLLHSSLVSVRSRSLCAFGIGTKLVGVNGEAALSSRNIEAILQNDVVIVKWFGVLQAHRFSSYAVPGIALRPQA
jgi:hypothetical protein